VHSTEDRGAEEKTEDVAFGEITPSHYPIHPGDFAVVDVGDGFSKRPFASAVAAG